jgi:hypothetical protein
LSKRPAEFGLFNWFPEHGADLVHPDDREAFACLPPAGRVFGVAQHAGWIMLSLGASHYRVRGHLLRPVPPPGHWIGDQVVFTSGGKTLMGAVREVHWHIRDEWPFYLLSADGKPLSKRYLDDDLSQSDSTS